jgi:hypothetical protein
VDVRLQKSFFPSDLTCNIIWDIGLGAEAGLMRSAQVDLQRDRHTQPDGLGFAIATKRRVSNQPAASLVSINNLAGIGYDSFFF